MWKRLLEVLDTAILSVLMPVLALAHGDDQMTVNTVFGPILAAFTIFTVVPIGKAVIRKIKK
jgi:hypothetical protein